MLSDEDLYMWKAGFCKQLGASEVLVVSGWRGHKVTHFGTSKHGTCGNWKQSFPPPPSARFKVVHSNTGLKCWLPEFYYCNSNEFDLQGEGLREELKKERTSLVLVHEFDSLTPLNLVNIKSPNLGKFPTVRTGRPNRSFWKENISFFLEIFT